MCRFRLIVSSGPAETRESARDAQRACRLVVRNPGMASAPSGHCELSVSGQLEFPGDGRLVGRYLAADGHSVLMFHIAQRLTGEDRRRLRRARFGDGGGWPSGDQGLALCGVEMRVVAPAVAACGVVEAPPQERLTLRCTPPSRLPARSRSVMPPPSPGPPHAPSATTTRSVCCGSPSEAETVAAATATTT